MSNYDFARSVSEKIDLLQRREKERLERSRIDELDAANHPNDFCKNIESKISEALLAEATARRESDEENLSERDETARDYLDRLDAERVEREENKRAAREQGAWERAQFEEKLLAEREASAQAARDRLESRNENDSDWAFTCNKRIAAAIAEEERNQ